MSVAPTETDPHAAATPDGATDADVPATPSFDRLLRTYFWAIFKNVVGWLCIVASPILGILLPGPGGIPLFVVGFALVTFPYKRRLTSHVFRGRRLPVESGWFTGLITFFSVLVTGGLMWATHHYYGRITALVPVLGDYAGGDVGKLMAIAAFALPATMLVSWVGLKLLNGVLLRWVPGLRRFLRRTLKKYGVRLLPARRRRIGGRVEVVGQDEIIGLDDRQRRRLARLWTRLAPWLGRLTAVSLITVILVVIVRPVVDQWPAVEARIGRVDLLRVAAGIVAFALGLIAFRAATWRGLLRGFGRSVPLRAAARVWTIGHLARFIPGRSYLAVRMELARPYGVAAPQASAAQRLEGALAFAGGVAVGLVALWWAAWANLPSWRPLWVGLAAASPLLVLAVTPRSLYRLVPDPAGGRRPRAGRLLGLAAWQTAGVAWQAMAVWLIVGEPLAAGGAWLAVAGAWGLAWAAGHLAKWAPGGIGVREVVFVACLSVLLPPGLREGLRAVFDDSTFLAAGGIAGLTAGDLFAGRAWQDVWWAFLFFLGLLLRLATTAAELLAAVAATAFDWPALVAFARGEPPPIRGVATSSR